MGLHTVGSNANTFPCAGYLLCLSGLLSSSQRSFALCTLQENNSLLHFVLVLFPFVPFTEDVYMDASLMSSV